MPCIFKINHTDSGESALQVAAEALRKGLLVVHPTETFYGLGALYSNEKSLMNLFRIKSRDLSKPLLLLIKDIAAIQHIAPNIPDELFHLADTFWPGPLTLLIRSSPHLSPLLAGPDRKIGCRMTSNAIAQRLLTYADAPMTSTSANISGGPSPTSVASLSPAILHAADVILDGGQTRGGLPSTVLDLTVKPFKIVRKGALSMDLISAALQPFGSSIIE